MVSDLEALSKALTAGAAACDKAAEDELVALIVKNRDQIEQDLTRDGQAIIMFRGVPYKVTKNLTP